MDDKIGIIKVIAEEIIYLIQKENIEDAMHLYENVFYRFLNSGDAKINEFLNNNYEPLKLIKDMLYVVPKDDTVSEEQKAENLIIIKRLFE